MESKHTPGPWVIRQGSPELENHIANVRGIDIYGPYAAIPCINDARLIAAAPEQHVALGKFIAWCNKNDWGCVPSKLRETIINSYNKAEGLD